MFESPEFFVVTVDDNDVSYANSVAAIAAANGGRMTFFLNSPYLEAGEDATITTMVAAGHEVSNHAWSHSGLMLTDGMSVTSTNTNPTVNVDKVAKQITLSCDEGANIVTMSWALTENEIGALQTAVAGKGWVVVPAAGVQTRLRLSSLASTGGPITVPATLLLASSGTDYSFWENEIQGNEDALAVITGVRPDTLCWVGGVVGDSLRDWVIANTAIQGARGTGDALQMLDSVQLFETSNSYSWFGDGSETAIRSGAAAAYQACVASKHGCMFVALCHHAAECSLDQVGWLMDEIRLRGGQWVTYSEAIAAIRANHSSADGITWTPYK